MKSFAQLRSAVLVAAYFAVLCAAAPEVARAEHPPELKRFAGQYAYAGTKDEGQAIVDKAFDAALQKLNMVMRLVMKKALSQGFAETVVVELPGDKISVKVGDREPVPTEPGKPQTVTRDGRTGKLTQRLVGNKLEILIEGDDGSVRNVLELATDGKTLRRSVTVTSPKLDKPVSYALLYTKK
jgi:hypothetical protein